MSYESVSYLSSVIASIKICHWPLVCVLPRYQLAGLCVAPCHLHMRMTRVGQWGWVWVCGHMQGWVCRCRCDCKRGGEGEGWRDKGITHTNACANVCTHSERDGDAESEKGGRVRVGTGKPERCVLKYV